MRKKIKVSQLHIGMFVDKFDGNWLKHPFWKTSFKLDNAKDLKAINDSGISHLWIDTSKGDDIESINKPQIEVIDKKPEPAAVTISHTSLHEELEVARETLAHAKKATTEMFQEARMAIQ